MILMKPTFRKIGIQISGDYLDLSNLYATLNNFINLVEGKNVNSKYVEELNYTLNYDIRKAKDGQRELIKMNQHIANPFKHEPSYYSSVRISWPRILGVMLTFKIQDLHLDLLTQAELNLFFSKIVDQAHQISERFGTGIEALYKNEYSFDSFEHINIVINAIEINFVHEMKKDRHHKLLDIINPNSNGFFTFKKQFFENVAQQGIPLAEVEYSNAAYNWRW